jgi:TolB-like protein
LLIAIFSGCSKRYHNLPVFSAFPISDSVNHSVGRFKTSYLADQIHAYFRGHANAPIAVTTFVDVDNLYQSSTFGRILAEQLMSELTMRGYRVVEMRLSDSMQIMFQSGEFSLSRETGIIRDNQEISAIVVGTYAASPHRVYLNSRMIDPSSSMILSAGTVEMRKTREIARLLRTSSQPTSLERIPVRHLGYRSSPAPQYWPPYAYNAPNVPQGQNWAPQAPDWDDSWTTEEKELMVPEAQLPNQQPKDMKDTTMNKQPQMADK